MTDEMVLIVGQSAISILVVGLAIYTLFKIRAKWEIEKEKTIRLLGFPENIKDFWASYAWHQLSKEDRWSFPENMPEDTKIVHTRIVSEADRHDLVITYRLGERYGVYELLLGKPAGGSDRAMWDDGMEYDLKLVDVVDLAEAIELTESSLSDSAKRERKYQQERAVKREEEEKLLTKCWNEAHEAGNV